MIIAQEIKESWKEIWDQLFEDGHVTVEPGRLPRFGTIDDEDFNSYAEFRQLGGHYGSEASSLGLTTAWSNWTYQFFTRKGKHYVLYNGGRNGFLQQRLFPRITTVGIPQEMDLG